jgi:hypothetical protein
MMYPYNLLFKPYLLVCLVLLCALPSNSLLAEKAKFGKPTHKIGNLNPSTEADSGTDFHLNKSNKICSCQILALQNNFRRQRNFALFAEITKRKNINSDLTITRKLIEKEKKYMKAMFYDKVEVIKTYSEVTDCRSLFKKLKTDHKQLYLYDILDADVRR